MKLDAGMALFERGPLCLRLLHPVLAEAALAGGDRLLDRLRQHGLGHRDERRSLSASRAGGRGREGDPAPSTRRYADRDVDPSVAAISWRYLAGFGGCVT